MWNKLKSLIQPKTNLQCRPYKYYTGAQQSLFEIEQHLAQYEGGSIDLEKDESLGIATLIINHYKKRNAISGKMMVDLANAVTSLEAWETGKGVLLYGNNHTFCSGADLDFACKTANPDNGYCMSVFMDNALDRFQKLPFLTVAVIEGAALGGGAELASACDFRLITEDALGIGFVHARMGIVPAWGGATRLAAITGYRTALDLLTTARIVGAKDALSLGLVDTIISSDNAISEAKDWLMLRTKYAPDVIHATKAIVSNTRHLSYEEALQEEKRIFAPLWGGYENQKALEENVKHKL